MSMHIEFPLVMMFDINHGYRRKEDAIRMELVHISKQESRARNEHGLRRTIVAKKQPAIRMRCIVAASSCSMPRLLPSVPGAPLLATPASGNAGTTIIS